MASILLGFAAYKRTGIPEAVVLNCLSEAVPTKPSAPLALIARPGLENFENIGTAPIRGVFAKTGLLGDAALIVANTTAYLVTVGGMVTPLTGTIPGDDLVEIDGGLGPDGNSIIRIATGSALYMYDSAGISVVQESFPTSGGAGATSVGFLSGYWLATEAGTDAVYYQEPASTTWGALEFASAEYAPDPNAGVKVFGDLAALLGKATTEFWRATGVSASPLEPAGGLKFDFGCRAIAAAVNCAGTLIWVDNNCSVQLSEGGPPRAISDTGLAEQIRRTPAVDLSASYFQKDQHPCYVLHLGTSATWTFDLSTQRWTRFGSLDLSYWRPRLFANIGDTVLATDRLSNQVWRLDPDRRTDGSEVFPIEFPGFLEVAEGFVDLANITLDCLTGDAPRSGQGSAPVIGLRLSHDGGHTYGAVRYRSMGLTGDYTATPRWNSLGMAKAPLGVICKWEISDPVGRRFSAARYNVA